VQASILAAEIVTLLGTQKLCRYVNLAIIRQDAAFSYTLSLADDNIDSSVIDTYHAYHSRHKGHMTRAQLMHLRQLGRTRRQRNKVLRAMCAAGYLAQHSDLARAGIPHADTTWPMDLWITELLKT